MNKVPLDCMARLTPGGTAEKTSGGMGLEPDRAEIVPRAEADISVRRGSKTAEQGR
jgi:hypothetical protein